MIAVSCNDVDMHAGWIKDIQSYANLNESNFPYPIIQDPDRSLAVRLGMLVSKFYSFFFCSTKWNIYLRFVLLSTNQIKDGDEKDKAGMPLTARAVSFFNDISDH